MSDSMSHQARKSQRTRERLLDATLKVIAAEGLANASTARICDVAGVSRGAQTHHYPAKNELVLASLERAMWRYGHALEELLESLAPSNRLLGTVVRSLWEAFLDDQFISSALEVLVAARTDAALRPAVIEADRTAVNGVVALSAQITHPTASSAQLAQVLEMTFYYFRGLALERGIHDDDKFRQSLVDLWCDTLERSLAQL